MDITTLSLAKKYANKVAAGFSNVEVQGNNLIFTLNDGTKATMTIPIPENGSDGVSVIDLSIDENGNLLCHMSNGSTINAGKIPTDGLGTGTGNVSSDIINSIVVVDTLPEVEEDGVLYLVKEIKYITNPTMKMGYISTSNGTEREATDHCISADYIYIKGKPKLTISNSASLSMRVLCYDKDKNFMTNWHTDGSGTSYNYKHLESGDEFTCPDNAYYIRFRISSPEVVDVTITYV